MSDGRNSSGLTYVAQEMGENDNICGSALSDVRAISLSASVANILRADRDEVGTTFSRDCRKS